MLNMKMYLSDGREIYPVYMSAEERKNLKEYIGDKREYMWCGCRVDIKLYYRLSEDLRFYPERQGYEHTKTCTRFDIIAYRKRTGYILNEEKGTVTAYLKFNPLTFPIPKQKDKDDLDEPVTESIKKSQLQNEKKKEEDKEAKASKNKQEKNPFLSLPDFIRNLNIDTYNERILTGGKILSHEYFSSTLFSRMKYVNIFGVKKTLRSLTLLEDNVKFFYSTYKGSLIKEGGERTSHFIKLANREGKEFNCYIYERTLRKAEEEFIKIYGIEPRGNLIMAAGFQYNMTRRNKESSYRVIGRLHLFLVSEHGLYCRSLAEQQSYNVILDYIRIKGRGRINFIVPIEDEPIAGVFEIKGIQKKGILRNFIEEENNDNVKGNIKSEEFLDYNILKNPLDTSHLESFIRRLFIKS